MSKLKLIYKELQKKRRRIKTRSLLLIIFLFGVNAYAWFVYMSSANLTLAADVTTWNVSFFEGSNELKEMEIKTSDLYPGMEKMEREFKINNKSNASAEFKYEISDIVLFGNKVTTDNELLYLNNSLPVKIDFNVNKTELSEKDSMTAVLSFEWPYEALNDYYKVVREFDYDNNYIYYENNVSSFVTSSVNELNYNDKVLSGLYLESDDADTIFSELCNKYKTDNNKDTCLTFHLKLSVIQKNNE